MMKTPETEHNIKLSGQILKQDKAAATGMYRILHWLLSIKEDMDKLLAMDISNDLRQLITSLDAYKSCVSDMQKIDEYDKRCSGRTTRIIDSAVAELLTNGIVHVADHTGTKAMADHILWRVIGRLRNEHKIEASGTVEKSSSGTYFANIRLNDRK
jgi:hypothetical protein